MMEIIKLNSELCEKEKDSIASFIFKSFCNGGAFPGYSIENAQDKCRELKNYLKQNQALSFIAVIDGRPEGFIWAYPFPDRGDTYRMYVSILYVNKEFRKLSIGRHLIDAVEKEAKALGYNKIWLHTGGHNHTAIQFYDKSGFECERVQLVKKI